AERIKNAVEWSPRFRDIESGLTMTASLGVSVFPDKGIKSTKRLIRFADKALYRAKEIGKNRIVIGSSAGERPLGRGERLTQAEKRSILSRVADTLRGTLNLDEILDYLLREISSALQHNGWEPPCSVMLMDKKQGLQIAAERNPDSKYQADFQAGAKLALKKRRLQVFREKDGWNPATSYPILIDSPIRGREVVGVINIGTIPSDLNFFQDFAGQAALGITNAKLFREAQDAKMSLENKVNELTTLSMMGMTMQRNALKFKDFQQENFKLLARCLTRVGFERALVYEYDPDKKLLKNGVDDSLKGDRTPLNISLAGLRKTSFFISAVSKKEVGRHRPPVSFSAAGKLGVGDRKILKMLGIDKGDAALLGLNGDGEIKYLVIVVKPLLQKEDLAALSQFILHAGLVMENLNLSRMFQGKTERLTLLHETCVNLSTAETSNDWTLAAHEALSKLTGVLDAAEISVYSFTGQDQMLKLVAYASASALPGREPAQRVRLKDSKIMGALVNNVLKKGLPAPLVVEDIGSLLGRRSKKRFATASYLGIPLFSGGEFLGVMNITDKLDQTPFTPDDVELAQVTGGLLASVLKNILLISR
ncbi:MAG: GAF domain-containing protein, partial [Thermodesulfobacteriota bacterium]|nr:GAF domain-containing protein [Thermodesulfobacteriota bacterium]